VLLMDLAYVTPTTAHHNDPRLKFVPESVREVWDQGRQQALQGRSAADFEFRTELRKRSLQIVGKMDAAGIPIMAGTDAAAPNVFPGFGLQEELSYLVLAGLTPQQALRSATVGPAEFLNRTETQGTIAPGKRADLVLLDGNPLDDITNTQHIRAVVMNGKAFERNGLDQLLNSAANFAARH
jgi:imidazolonepropionase-like amidohydrolase